MARQCLTAASCLLALPVVYAGDVDFSGYVGAQQRWFYNDPVDARQGDAPTALSVEPEWYYRWNDGSDSLIFTPYLRWDSDDDERSHGDIRELYWLHVNDGWELGVGISKVFWGVTESQHLVDIVNQTDLVEAPDGEEKLGQPMVRWSTQGDWGVIDLFALPGFRERTFPGSDGRLRSAIVVDQDRAQYESAAEERHVDVAARWLQTLGQWDLGLSYFRGTSREPEFIRNSIAGEPVLTPYYPQIDQLGVDAQLTTGGWLWKFEAIGRDGGARDFAAMTGGFEYTFYGVFERIWDIGLIGEYSLDTRDEKSTTGLQDDVFVGGRFSWNDMASSELLMGITQDLDNSRSASGKLEANTRLGEAAKVYFEVWYFDSDNPTDPFYPLRKDSFVEVSVEYYF